MLVSMIVIGTDIVEAYFKARAGDRGRSGLEGAGGRKKGASEGERLEGWPCGF